MSIGLKFSVQVTANYTQFKIPFLQCYIMVRKGTVNNEKHLKRLFWFEDFRTYLPERPEGGSIPFL